MPWHVSCLIAQTSVGICDVDTIETSTSLEKTEYCCLGMMNQYTAALEELGSAMPQLWVLKLHVLKLR